MYCVKYVLIHNIVIQTANKFYNFEIFQYSTKVYRKIVCVLSCINITRTFWRASVYSAFRMVGDTEVTRDRLRQRDVNNSTLHRKRK